MAAAGLFIRSGACLNLFWNGLHLAIEEIISLLLPLRLLMKGLKPAPLPNYRVLVRNKKIISGDISGDICRAAH